MRQHREPQQHLKICDYLKEQIRSGELQPGDQLPSEAELCAQFNSSRGPVRQAMAVLRTEGAISSGRGRRSVVLGNFNAETFDSIISVSSWLTQHGYTPQQKTFWLARRPAPEDVAQRLGVGSDEQVVYVHRLRSCNDRPMVIERLYFPIDVGQEILNFDADSGSLHAHLHAAGVDFDNVNRRIHIGTATADDAEVLGIEPGSPIWTVEMLISNHQGCPVELAVYCYRADALSVNLSSVRGGASPLEVFPGVSDN